MDEDGRGEVVGGGEEVEMGGWEGRSGGEVLEGGEVCG